MLPLSVVEAMKIKCPSCKSVFEVSSTAAGGIVRCACGAKLRVPSPSKIAPFDTTSSSEVPKHDSTEDDNLETFSFPDASGNPLIDREPFEQGTETGDQTSFEQRGSSPQITSPFSSSGSTQENKAFSTPEIDPEDEKTIRSIIREGERLLVYSILGVVCCSCMLLIFIFPIWYYWRLRQWNRFSEAYPLLLDPNAPPGSLPRQFQDCRRKLHTGFVIGICCFSTYAFFSLIGLLLKALGIEANP